MGEGDRGGLGGAGKQDKNQKGKRCRLEAPISAEFKHERKRGKKAMF